MGQALNSNHRNDFIIIILSLLNDISYFEQEELVGRAFLSVKNEKAILACNFFPLKKSFIFPLLFTDVDISNYCNFYPKDFEEIALCKAHRNNKGKLELSRIDI